jgi:hypothetical protein
MRHFIAYHNAEDMGYSSTSLISPRVKTKNPVVGLEGVTVWLIAGEGKSPKSFYVAAKFTATTCEPSKYPGTALPNEISGAGTLFKFALPIDATPLLKALKGESRNFRNGFHEVSDPAVIAALEATASGVV